jgi:hypothetical protein
LERTDKQFFWNKISISIYCSGFYFKDCDFHPTYWLMAEAKTAKNITEFDKEKYLNYYDYFQKQTFIFTGRAALWWRHWDMPLSKAYIIRHDTGGLLPPDPRRKSASIINSIATAVWMGAANVYVYGLDLCASCGQYVSGVPLTEDKKKRKPDFIYSKQVEVLRKINYNNVNIYNASPCSAGLGLPFQNIVKPNECTKRKCPIKNGNI